MSTLMYAVLEKSICNSFCRMSTSSSHSYSFHIFMIAYMFLLTSSLGYYSKIALYWNAHLQKIDAKYRNIELLESINNLILLSFFFRIINTISVGQLWIMT